MDLFSYINVENLERNITTNISLRFCEIVLPQENGDSFHFTRLFYLKLVIINKNTAISV